MERLLTGIGITSQVTLNKVGYHVVPRDAAVLVGLGRGALIADLAGRLPQRLMRVELPCACTSAGSRK